MGILRVCAVHQGGNASTEQQAKKRASSDPKQIRVGSASAPASTDIHTAEALPDTSSTVETMPRLRNRKTAAAVPVEVRDKTVLRCRVTTYCVAAQAYLGRSSHYRDQ